jgi:hypothetical protein
MDDVETIDARGGPAILDPQDPFAIRVIVLHLVLETIDIDRGRLHHARLLVNDEEIIDPTKSAWGYRAQAPSELKTPYVTRRLQGLRGSRGSSKRGAVPIGGRSCSDV